MTKGLIDDYRKGEMSGFIFANVMTVHTVSALANRTLNCAKDVAPSGADALEMKRQARVLDDAAEALRAAADLAYPKSVVMQAAE